MGSVLMGCGPRAERIVMNAENNSGQSGFAVLTELGGARVRVELDIAPSNDPREQIAHIHQGRCGEIGVIDAQLTNLALDATTKRFTSTTEVSRTLMTLLNGSYAINVHDARDFSLYVSCGQIR